MAKILIIDDDPGVVSYLKRLLERLGHETDAANDGAAGLERAKDASFELIVSDLYMPGEPSRLDLIREIRTARPDCPLIVVSGYPSEDRLDECRQLGVAEFLTKPFEVSFIRSVLNKLGIHPSSDAQAAGERKTEEG